MGLGLYLQVYQQMILYQRRCLSYNHKPYKRVQCHCNTPFFLLLLSLCHTSVEETAASAAQRDSASGAESRGVESHCQVSDVLSEVAHAEGAAAATEPATCCYHDDTGIIFQTWPGSRADPDAGRWERLNSSIFIFSTAVFTKHTLSDQAGSESCSAKRYAAQHINVGCHPGIQ